MPIQSGSAFTAIHFKHLAMSGDWTQSALIDFYEYTANKPSLLVVVEEMKSGTNVAWLFSLNQGDLVTVNYADSQVHVPRLPERTVSAGSPARLAALLKGRPR
jgi:hypothetical protein